MEPSWPEYTTTSQFELFLDNLKRYWESIISTTEENYKKMVGSSVRAELYRVNDAITLEGERLTSTSLSMKLTQDYDSLSQLHLADSRVIEE